MTWVRSDHRNITITSSGEQRVAAGSDLLSQRRCCWKGGVLCNERMDADLIPDGILVARELELPSSV